MIHPMWVEFARAFAPAVWTSGGMQPDETPAQCRARFAARIADMADLMCSEYDKRDKVSGGSPYRS